MDLLRDLQISWRHQSHTYFHIQKPYCSNQLGFILKKYEQLQSEQATTSVSYQFSKAFDAATLEQIFGGRETHIIPIFETFVRTTSKELDSIKDLEKEQNWEGLAEKLHKIKPSFSLVGLPNISQSIKSLENLCRTVTSPEKLKDGLAKFYEKVSQAISLVITEKERIGQFFG